MSQPNVVGEKRLLGGRPEPTHEQANPHLTQLAEELRKKEGEQIKAKSISIFEIWPDWKQPRRTMPSRVRDMWDGQPTNLPNIFGNWWEIACQESGVDIDLHGVVNGGLNEDQLPSLPDDAALAESFLKLASLAASIQQDGLTNPITVVRAGDDYQLETGERRWLAYHLLHWLSTGAEKWQKIPARLVDNFNIWRQAAENNARDELKAVGKARQFALLLMELLAQEGQEFDSFEAFGYGNEQSFYAQVAEARIPPGKASILLTAMGVKHRAAFSRCRTILKVEPELWKHADDYNLPEDTVLRLARGEDVATRNNDADEQDNPSVSQPGKKTPALPREVKDFKIGVAYLLDTWDDVEKLDGNARPDARRKAEWVRDMAQRYLDRLDRG